MKDPNYLKFVRGQDCCSCGISGPCTKEGRIDPHHYMEGHGGTALKVSDYWTVPLCRKCHDYFHDKHVLPCFKDMEHDAGAAHTRIQIYRTQSRLMGMWMDIF